MRLSRACRGKMLVFIYKWLKKTVFRHLPLHACAVVVAAEAACSSERPGESFDGFYRGGGRNAADSLIVLRTAAAVVVNGSAQDLPGGGGVLVLAAVTTSRVPAHNETKRNRATVDL